ncbi:MAG: metal-dependent hydrolase [Haloferacaceae archaeon]
MFVGHALFAFALVAVVAARREWTPSRALAVGGVAGAFAAVPDVDIAYALVGLVGAHGGPVALASSFWATGSVVHRAVTHSILVAPVVAAAVGLWVASGRPDGRHRSLAALALLALSGLVAVAAVESGVLGGAMMALFGVAALVVAEAVRRRTTLAPGYVAAAALVGLVSHPFGDLFTGTPPAMLYPVDASLVAHRLVLASDPTLHLLAAFGVELAVVWSAVAVFCSLAGLRPSVEPRATLGAGYAASVFLIPAPTLDLSYPFVFSVLAVGSLGVLPGIRLRSASPIAAPDRTTALVTGLTAVTVAWLAYGVAYLAL